jgi:hypothetical protein
MAAYHDARDDFNIPSSMSLNLKIAMHCHKWIDSKLRTHEVPHIDEEPEVYTVMKIFLAIPVKVWHVLTMVSQVR